MFLAKSFKPFSLIIFLIFIFFPLPIFTQETPPQKEPLSEYSRQWLEEVVPYIITPAEKEVFINLPTEAERGRFIENFWKKRDPNPETPENEFKIEYYKRIALANKFFGSGGIAGWRTDRGKIYILLGPPNEIQRDFSSQGSSLYGFHGPKEVWNYWGLSNPRLPYNLEFVFVDKLGTGNYVLEQSLKLGEAGATHFDIDSMHSQFNSMEVISEALRNPFEGLDRLKGIITTQVTYDRIPIDFLAFYFKGEEKQTFIPLSVKIPYSSMSSKEIEDGLYFNFTLVVNVSDEMGRVVYERSKEFNFKHGLSEVKEFEGKTFEVQTSLKLEPGDYKLHLLVLDNFSGKIGTIHEELKVPEFRSEGLSLSEIILSHQREVEIEREPQEEISQKFRSGEEMNVYFEVYNLTLEPLTGKNDFNLKYAFLQGGKILAEVTSPKQEPRSERDCRIQTSFRLKNFKPGEYTLRVILYDLSSGKEVSKEVSFLICE